MSQKIAIVGLSGRFPGAESAAQYWRNLVSGVESIADLSDAELLGAGVSAEELRAPGYVKRAPVLHDVAAFDARFFGFSRPDACMTDPQQRMFLEVCRDALDDSGLTGVAKRMRTGVFATAGGSVSSYLLAAAESLAKTQPLSTGGAIHLGNDKDFLSTKASYKLDLRGPSVNIQTACSSSLVVLHFACQSLLGDECDIALAGASCVRVPHVTGYRADSDPILSKDGRCRPFDAGATGTLFGSGVGAVVLRRYEDALEDADNIYAVILATGINNDGGQKVTYTASSVPAQRACIEAVLDKAGVSAQDIGYVECHGTATKVGDPLEIKSLTQAFRTTSSAKSYCAIGSVKSNIGHLEQAAGMASLIKTALMLKHGTLVPSLHCETLNPKIHLDESPFYVIHKAAAWSAARPGQARTAGINCLGMGGTNAFAVLQEHRAGARPAGAPAVGETSLFCLSAKSEEALAAYAGRYVDFLSSDREAKLAEIAYTTNISRAEFGHRLAVKASAREELVRELQRCMRDKSNVNRDEKPALAYVCRLDRWYAADDLIASILQDAPGEVVRDYADLVRRIDESGQCRAAATGEGIAAALMRDIVSMLRCEYLGYSLIRHYGAVVEERRGAGIGGEFARCLDRPDLLVSFVDSVHERVAAWADVHGEPAADAVHPARSRNHHVDVRASTVAVSHRAPDESERKDAYRSFVRHFRAAAEDAAISPPRTEMPPALEQKKYCFVQMRGGEEVAPSAAITISDYADTSGYDAAGLVQALYLAGSDIDWHRYYRGKSVRKISLPSYPYQRGTYWFTDMSKKGDAYDVRGA